MSMAQSEVNSYYAADEEFDPADSEHTDLDAVPDEAVIHFEGEDEPRTGIDVRFDDSDDGEWPDAVFADATRDGTGIRFFIERAMMDPEARVEPV